MAEDGQEKSGIWGKPRSKWLLGIPLGGFVDRQHGLKSLVTSQSFDVTRTWSPPIFLQDAVGNDSGTGHGKEDGKQEYLSPLAKLVLRESEEETGQRKQDNETRHRGSESIEGRPERMISD